MLDDSISSGNEEITELPREETVRLNVRLDDIPPERIPRIQGLISLGEALLELVKDKKRLAEGVEASIRFYGLTGNERFAAEVPYLLWLKRKLRRRSYEALLEERGVKDGELLKHFMETEYGL